MNKNIRAGGQALIEGVMMLVNGGIALSVRKKNNEIKTITRPYKRYSERKKIFSFPFIRGIVSFIEMLQLGIDGLNKSADIYYEEDSKKTGLKDKIITAFTIIFALAIGMLLFMYLPIKLINLAGVRDNLLFNVFIGIIRLVFFFFYIIIISLMKDVKRVFMYHGAEHKVVHAFENNEELTIENAKKYSTKHPRCGTSFIFIVLITAIIFYSLLDTIIFNALSIPNTPLNRLINHLILLPFVAAIAFEVLSATGRFFKYSFVKVLVYPGIFFQYLTTKEPTDDMLEVSITSLKSALKSAGMEEFVEKNT